MSPSDATDTSISSVLPCGKVTLDHDTRSLPAFTAVRFPCLRDLPLLLSSNLSSRAAVRPNRGWIQGPLSESRNSSPQWPARVRSVRRFSESSCLGCAHTGRKVHESRCCPPMVRRRGTRTPASRLPDTSCHPFHVPRGLLTGRRSHRPSPRTGGSDSGRDRRSGGVRDHARESHPAKGTAPRFRDRGAFHAP